MAVTTVFSIDRKLVAGRLVLYLEILALAALARPTVSFNAQELLGLWNDSDAFSQADPMKQGSITQILQRVSLRASASPVSLTYPFNQDVCQLLLEFSSPVVFTHTKVTINTLTGVVSVLYSLASHSSVISENSVSYTSSNCHQTYQLSLPEECRFDKASLRSSDAGFSIHPERMKLRVWIPHRERGTPPLASQDFLATPSDTETDLDLDDDSQEQTEEPISEETEERISQETEEQTSSPTEPPPVKPDVLDEVEISLPERHWEV